jgi:hypothetical protein
MEEAVALFFAWLDPPRAQALQAAVEQQATAALDGLNTQGPSGDPANYRFGNPVNHIVAIFHAFGNLPDRSTAILQY